MKNILNEVSPIIGLKKGNRIDFGHGTGISFPNLPMQMTKRPQ